ncbi:hypothetical protein [Desulfobacter postgatei]|uniref:hypothetical protein n=1 Tax=Desulfobacter postgatei TaxID=2293 RepID=UPI00259B79CD|nr:hypothetical protein [uncultured Desulfobacter sp.]
MARRFILIILCIGIVASSIAFCFADDKLREIEHRIQLLSNGVDLTPEQADEIRDILVEVQNRVAEEQNEMNSSDPNWAKEQIDKEVDNKILAVLTPEQQDKFKKFSMQNPYKNNLIELKQRLYLDEEQTKSIEFIMASKASEIEALKTSSEGKDPRQYHHAMKKIMDAQAEQIEKLLTKEQTKEFRALRREHEKKRKERGPQR